LRQLKGRVGGVDVVPVEDEVDRQREVFAAILRRALSAGAITLNEFESKLGATYAAQTLEDLEPLAPWGLVPRQ
jgi:Domain of unknown function (DUF1707)